MQRLLPVLLALLVLLPCALGAASTDPEPDAIAVNATTGPVAHPLESLPLNADVTGDLVLPLALVGRDVATLFAIRNVHNEAVWLEMTFVESLSGTKETPLGERLLDPLETLTFNLADLLGPGPREGHLVFRALDRNLTDPLADPYLHNVLVGDFVLLDSANNFASGERLAQVGEDACHHPTTRFLAGGAFDGGTTYSFYLPTPLPERADLDAEPTLVADFYDEAGNYLASASVHTRRRSFHLSMKAFLDALDWNRTWMPPFGAVQWTAFRDMPILVSQTFSASDRFSLTTAAPCLDATPLYVAHHE